MKKTASFLMLCLLLGFLIFKTEQVRCSVIESLKLCGAVVIPTLFPFFVISGVLVNLGFVTVLGKFFSPIAHLLFKVSGKGAVVFIIGIICGYPTGAKVIANMVEEKSLDKCEAERLLAFCNNSGPLFVIGAVGTAMLRNHNLGVILYIIHLLSSIITGVILRNFATDEKLYKNNEIEANNVAEAISKAIESAVRSVLNVCGYVVFFAILCDMAKSVFLISLLEVTIGAKNLILQGLKEDITLVLLSGIIGFGGICVLMQVQSAVAKVGLSLKFYVLGKIVQSVISMLLTFFYVSIFEVRAVFSPVPLEKSISLIPLFLFLVSGMLCIFRLTKRG